MSNYLFRAKTTEGYLFKVIAEILQNNQKTCCLVIDENGIKSKMADQHTNVLIDIELQSDNFNIYEFNFNGVKTIGLNLIHFSKMLKSVKKKDSIEIFIINDQDTNFGIKIIPKDNSRVTTSYIKIQNIQNIDFQLDENYVKPIIISATEYHKMIKDMLSIGTTIQIESGLNFITFKCIADELYEREVTFNNDTSNNLTETSIIYTDIYNIDLLNKFNKISGLSKTMYIYMNENKPLLFKSRIGSLGDIKIYIKSVQQSDNSNSINE